ncbi:MAG: hypothetical protein U1E51_26920 [Candidatus Binatia bacterium]|nr:hypothetical protein [Candidatus Binatia bacterium]
MALTLLLAVLALWVLFNWAAPFATLVDAARISPGRLPAALLTSAGARKARFYTANLPRGKRIGLGFSIWAPPFSAVVFDREFFAHASTPMIRFVVAHELAHFSLGHHRMRWWAVVSGAILLPAVRQRLVNTEDEADAEATRRTGLAKSMFPGLM